MPRLPQVAESESKALQRAVTDAVMMLEGRQLMLIWYRYYCALPLQQVAVLMDLDGRQAAKLEGAAIRALRRPEIVRELRGWVE